MRSIRWLLIGATLVASIPGEPTLSQEVTRTPGELAWAIRYDPKTFDPAEVDEQASEKASDRRRPADCFGPAAIHLPGVSKHPDCGIATIGWGSADDLSARSFMECDESAATGAQP